jgi:hypothetical protein
MTYSVCTCSNASVCILLPGVCLFGRVTPEHGNVFDGAIYTTASGGRPAVTPCYLAARATEELSHGVFVECESSFAGSSDWSANGCWSRCCCEKRSWYGSGVGSSWDSGSSRGDAASDENGSNDSAVGLGSSNLRLNVARLASSNIVNKYTPASSLALSNAIFKGVCTLTIGRRHIAAATVSSTFDGIAARASCICCAVSSRA